MSLIYYNNNIIKWDEDNMWTTTKIWLMTVYELSKNLYIKKKVFVLWMPSGHKLIFLIFLNVILGSHWAKPLTWEDLKIEFQNYIVNMINEKRTTLIIKCSLKLLSY